ncbi:hypothetical protein MBLNU459_g5629t2 [Dothideomycetes sp. NU459]
MPDEPRKRSRFDQTEADPRRSRFDRRSRSPSNRDSEPRRSRSPVVRSTESPSNAEKRDPAAAAAAAAAKINAQIQARKGIQHVDVPPIRATQSPSTAQSPSAGAGALNNDIYTQDGDYIRDIEVNDLRNRYTLTKGSTQKMRDTLLTFSTIAFWLSLAANADLDCVTSRSKRKLAPVCTILPSLTLHYKAYASKDVTTRGSYYPDKALATAANPPLYLHITSTSREGLEKAVAEIDELMKQDLPNLVDERRFRRREPEQFERDSMGRRKWPEERIPVDLEPIPGFNLRAQVVGQGGSYVKHIQQETRCRVQIKGRGSGFMEHDTGNESDEQMYLHVAGPDPAEVARAKDLCLDLLQNVRTQYEQFKERGPRGGGGGGDHGDRGYRGGYGDRERNSSYGGGGGNGGYGGGYNGGYGGGYGGQQSPTAVTQGAGAPMSPSAAQGTPDYNQAYAQYYAAAGQNGQDPYAQYGGYDAYVKMYWEYYQQQQAAPQQAPGDQAPSYTETAPPPPPPTEDAPPPPGSGGYNAVPPPPGM